MAEQQNDIVTHREMALHIKLIHISREKSHRKCIHEIHVDIFQFCVCIDIDAPIFRSEFYPKKKTESFGCQMGLDEQANAANRIVSAHALKHAISNRAFN